MIHLSYYITWDLSKVGKRLEEGINDVSNLPAAETYFMDNLKLVFSDRHFKQCADGNCELIFSTYDAGQGFAYHSGSNKSQFTLHPTQVHPSGPEAELNLRLSNNVRNSVINGMTTISVNGQLIDTFDFQYKPQVAHSITEIPVDGVFDGMSVELEGHRASTDYHAVASIELTYPRQFDFNGLSEYTIFLDAASEARHILIENFNGGDMIEGWDMASGTWFTSHRDSNGHYSFHLPPSGKSRKLRIINPLEATHPITDLINVPLQDFSGIDPNFIIISHPDLYDDGQGQNWVNAYAEYRATEDGGGFVPVVVSIEELYDQFAYGIDRHPSSVRLFVQWFSKNWTDPKFLFIIGKGVEAWQIRNKSNDWQFVPVFGNPGADALICSDNFYRPLLPTGRIPVINGKEVETYLRKVILHEAHINSPQSLQDREWAKNGVHLSGGRLDDAWELALIRKELDDMKEVIEPSMLGMKIHTFQKKTTGTVTVSDNQRLTDLINNGVSLVTYFGHSGVQLIDFQIIDDVTTLPVNDKFHVYAGMGCYAGQIFDQEQRSYSEKWTLADRRGAIAFVANSSAGFISSLQLMGTKIYEGYGNKYYGEAIGLSIYDAIGQFLEENRDTSNALYFSRDVELAFSLNICGDPAIKLCTGKGPDFIVDPQSVTLNETIITSETDSLTLQFTAVNLGKVVEDSIVILVEQTLPSGEMETVLERRIRAPRYRDTLRYRIPSLMDRAVGLNKLNITIDAHNDVEELPENEAELNNDLEYNDQAYCFYVSSDDARPVMPEDFDIVGERNITLVASTSDALATMRNYVLEIDTTELFNSPVKLATRIHQRGGVIEWQPPINWTDETVYYWRISPDSTNGSPFSWRSSSFVFIDQHPPGWNQSHYYQFLYDEFDRMRVNGQNRRWEFDRAFTDIKVKNLVVNTDLRDNPTINRNGFREWEYWDHTRRFNPRSDLYRSGVYITIYEPSQITPVLNPSPGLYGSRNETGEDYPVFAFETTRYDQRVSLMKFLQDTVPDGHYVVFTTIREPANFFGIDQWAGDRDSTVGLSLIDLLEDQGATRILDLANAGEVPYVLIYKKNDRTFTPEEGIGNETDIMEVNAALPGFLNEGTTASVIIGPASTWDQYLWDNDEIENGKDLFHTEISGIGSSGGASILFDSVTASSVDLSAIDATEFPYILLRLLAADSIDRTCAQLNHWRISHESLPDLAVDASDHFRFYSDTLIQGENLLLSFTTRNISEYDMDSITVRYAIIDARNNEIVVDSHHSGLNAHSSSIFDFLYNTSALEGSYRLFVTVNPDGKQPELHLFNNSFVLPFFVLTDQRNPLLDVTFDGRYIKDGDLVSAFPEINIQLTDENEFLALNDTSILELYLRYPGTVTPRRVYFSDSDVSFSPGTTSKNIATVVLHRRFPDDGLYQLIVNGTDVSGNEAGEINYMVTFEVVNEMTISDLYNYPNPFFTNTHFVYSLSGGRSPQFYKIQIVDLNGKIVREIDQNEIGPLTVGEHLIAYTYDGTDQSGERLVNGIYLYKLIVQDENGQDVKRREIGDAHHDRTGWGRLVILR